MTILIENFGNVIFLIQIKKKKKKNGGLVSHGRNFDDFFFE